MSNIKRQTLAKVQNSPITLLAYAVIREYRGEGAAPTGRVLRLYEAASAAAAIQKTCSTGSLHMRSRRRLLAEGLPLRADYRGEGAAPTGRALRLYEAASAAVAIQKTCSTGSLHMRSRRRLLAEGLPLRADYRGEGAAPTGRALRLCEAASAAVAIQKTCSTGSLHMRSRRRLSTQGLPLRADYRGEGAAPTGRALRLCEAASAAAAIQKKCFER